MKKLLWIIPALLVLVLSIVVISEGHDSATIMVQMYLILSLVGLIAGDIANDPRKKRQRKKEMEEETNDYEE